MKTFNPTKPALVWRVLQCLGLVLSMLCFAGCQSTTYKKSGAAAKILDHSAADVQNEHRAIELTLAALDDLINRPAADLRPQFERFDHSLHQLRGSVKRNDANVERIAKRNASYLASWDEELTEINYELIRENSSARREEVGNELTFVHQRYEEAQGVVHPLIVYLDDIRSALEADLTMAGIEVVKSIAQNAETNARKVQSALSQLADDLGSTGSRVASTGPRQQNVGGTGDESRADVKVRTENSVSP